nr:cysteine proteinase 3-like [Tanacetum cinerariifolium]
RKVGIVSPVKNQGSCRSYWTFSTTGALEAAYAQAYEKLVSLCEQQLVDYAEEAYPYTGVDGVCKYSSENAAICVLETINITMGVEDELKHAVGVVRLVSVAFQVSGDFKQYTGGVYTSDSCGNDPMDVNHAVLVVGYGKENDVPYWLIKNSWGVDWGLGAATSTMAGRAIVVRSKLDSIISSQTMSRLLKKKKRPI